MRAAPAKVSLVALDLDGTVVSRDLVVTPRVRQAVAHARELGIRTTVITGRMYRSAKPFIDMLGIDAPVVCYQGGGIYDPMTDRALRHIPLPSAVALQVVAYAKSRKLHVQLYADDQFYIERVSDFSELYAYVSGLRALVVPSLEERFSQVDSTKAVIVVAAEEAQAIADDLRALLGDAAYVTRSNPEFVEILAPGIDKGDALRFVAERLGIPIEQTLGVGDSWNDIPLLQAAAFGVAMGSAPQAAQDVADAVVADVDHDGVAEAYDRFVFPTAVPTSRA